MNCQSWDLKFNKYLNWRNEMKHRFLKLEYDMED